MAKFSERFKELRMAKGLSQTECLKALRFNFGYQLSTSSISQYETGKTMPDISKIVSLAKFFNVSSDYLLGISNEREPASRFVKIPVLAYIRAGEPNFCDIKPISYEDIPIEMANSGEYFGLVVKGKSMFPNYMDGDIIIVRKQEVVEEGEVAVVLVGNNEGTLKKFYKHEAGIILEPINVNYPTLNYSIEEVEELPVRVAGKVVELRRKI